MAENNAPEQVGIVTQVERLKKAVQETIEFYQGELYISLPASGVLNGISELCDILLTGGDLEAFLIAKDLARPHLADHTNAQVEAVAEALADESQD